MDIEGWRRRIDEIDLEILYLLNKRAEFTSEIGKIKKQKRLPVYSPEREELIVRRMTNSNPGPLSNDGVRRIYERIIDESRKLEHEFLNE